MPSTTRSGQGNQVNSPIGFYEQSQEASTFSGFTIQPLPSATYTYTYDADAVDPDSDTLTYSFRPANNYAATVLSNSPIGYWRLGETNGVTAFDSSGHELHGTYLGDVRLGARGSLVEDADAAAQFSGGHIVVSNSTAIKPATITVEAWINPTTLPQWAWIIGRTATWGDGFALYYGGGYVIFWVNNYVANETLALLQPNTWVHVAGTFDGATMSLYFNGALVDSRPYTQPIDYRDTPLQIGYMQGGNRWDGFLDEVAFYDKALSASDIQAHYREGRIARYSAPPGMIIDPATGLIRWNPSASNSSREISSSDANLPVVPGFAVENYANILSPSQLALDAYGNLFVGQIAPPSGSLPELNVRRISPSTRLVTT